MPQMLIPTSLNLFVSCILYLRQRQAQRFAEISFDIYLGKHFIDLRILYHEPQFEGPILYTSLMC